VRSALDMRNESPRPMRPARRRTAPREPTYVELVDPDDGASGVFRDTVVLVRFSWPIDPLSLSDESFRVECPNGPVPGRIDLSPDGAILLWRSHRLLEARCVHVVMADGLRDERGEAVDRCISRFATSDLILGDITDSRA
jgi:hypothetical protein